VGQDVVTDVVEADQTQMTQRIEDDDRLDR
jgi:hypothetical protein